MNDRRTQWVRFYEAALAGAAQDVRSPHLDADIASVVRKAEAVADAAMARLDARDFPPSKVEVLIEAAGQVWESTTWINASQAIVTDAQMVALSKALAALREES